MALPADVTQMGSFKGATGDKGNKGDTGTLAWIDALSVPAGQAAAARMITDGRGQGAEIEVPRGLPGVNAVANDTATAAYVGATDSDTHGALVAFTEVSVFGVVGEVVARGSISNLQASADQVAAASSPRRSITFRAAGEITTNQTLILRSDFDLSALTINYTGTGVAFQIGKDTELIQNLGVARGPKVVHAGNTVGTGWASVPGTVGVRIVNVAQALSIEIPYVSQFETGLLIDGRNTFGCAWNVISIGNLYNNKRNLVMDNDGSGYTTQNTFLGGRFAHASAEGALVAGVEQILIKASANPSRNATSNNKFINPSIEGNVPQYHMSMAGRYNHVDNPRLETGVSGVKGRIRWHDGAQMNKVELGYAGEDVQWTVEGDSANNFIISPREMKLIATGPDPALSVAKAGLSTPHLSFYPAGHLAANGTPAGWIMQATGRQLDWRRQGDANARLRINGYDSEIRFGDGTVTDPPVGFRWHINGLQFFGGSILVAPAFDIGVGAQRPGVVRAGKGVALPIFTTANRPTPPEDGLTIIDSSINKTITYYKTAWRDAMGAVV